MSGKLPITLLFLMVLGVCVSSAQENLPYAEVEIQNVTPYFVQYHYDHNAACHHVYNYQDYGNEVELLSHVFGLSLEDVVFHWGKRYDTVWGHFWTNLEPGKEYTIWSVAADSNDRRYKCSGKPFRTNTIGGVGKSSIQIHSNFLSDTGSYVICVPNSETCGYQNGIVSASWFEKLGLDSLCRIINRNSTIYETDRWGRLLLNHGTKYCVIAFGRNANGLPGDTTVHWFTTPGDPLVSEPDTVPVISYSHSSDSKVLDIPENKFDQYLVRVSRPDRTKTLQETTLGKGNVIIATLPAGDYFVDVIRKQDGENIKEIRLYNRKKEVNTEYHEEADGFSWSKLRQDCLYAIGDSAGKAVTPFIFTQLEYNGGFFEGRTHSGNKLYGVILTKQGKSLIGADRHYDYICFYPYANTFWFNKDKKTGICGVDGKVIIAPLYDDILEFGNYYKVKQNRLYGCIDKNGKTVFAPQYERFEQDKYGFKALKDGVEYYLDPNGKVLGNSSQEIEWVEE